MSGARAEPGGRAHPAADFEYTTVFGSLADFRKGGVDVLDDDPKNYVFSNVFEVASAAAPYERVVVAKNMEYVIEALRADGTSPWFANAHDEFALCMDGTVEVHLLKPDKLPLAADADGGHRLDEPPSGRKMGRLVLRRGHMGLLPAGCVYRFAAAAPGVLTIQTVQGPASVEKWADICLK
ncbi:MAG: hydroxyquinol 1,2-dioxygenase [Alphaproteobacteria bacterium]